MTRRGAIERDVNSILEQSGIKRPPVPVEKIARQLGALVRYELVEEEDLSGALSREHGTPVIAVNSLHHENRQRFTIAHELGHLQLHAGTLYFDHHTPFQKRFRRGLASQGTDQEEIEANFFAASLLMPRLFLEEDAKAGLLDGIDLEELDSLRSLAKRYRVSPQAMALRLVNLGIISGLGMDAPQARLRRAS